MCRDVIDWFSASRFSPSSRSSRELNSLISLPKGQHSHFFLTKSAFQIFELAQNFAQLALHRERPFGALLAPSDGHVVEALSGLREEKCVGIFESETARHVSAPGTM